MKKVFPNSMVAHVWAQQKQDEGRSGNGNLSFSGDTLYSYGTPIARVVSGTRKRKAMLLTSQSYSVTTEGKHKNAAWNAWGRLNGPVFRVPFLGVTGGRAFRHADATNMKEVHKGNVKALFKQYQEYVAGTLRAMRPWYSSEDGAVNAFRDQADKVRDYCDMFGVHCPKMNYERDAGVCWARFARLAAKRETPQWKAAQERAAELAKQAEKVREWRSGAGPGYLYSLPVTIMRIKGDNIETSRGASFPISHGVRAWPFIIRARGKGWHANGHSIALGHFHIDEIETSGNVKAGCHYVEWSEIAAIATQLRAAGYDLPEG